MSRISEFKKRALQLKYNENQFDLDFDPYLRAIMAKEIVRKKTGVISNDEHKNHYCLWDDEHGENPNRIFYILKSICSSGVMARCEQLTPRQATLDEIEMLNYNSNIRILNEVISSRDSNMQSMEEFSSCFNTIYVNSGTINAVLSAAGSCIVLVDNILTGHIMNGMAIVRPPGHHASPNGGINKLCLINNAALAAEFAVQKHNLKRILIVDIDKEHGLGIQRHFYNRKDILYFSIHRFIAKPKFGMEESDCDSVGVEQGLGFNVNVPLNDCDITDVDYLNIFHYLLLPIAFEYKPQLVILCAGFNITKGAFDSEMLLTPPIFSYLIHKLTALAQSRLAVVLEGGFCLPTISDCSVLVLKALLDDPLPPLPPLKPPNKSVFESIFSVIAAQKKFWKSISDYQVTPIVPNIKKVEKTIMLQPGSYPTRNYLVLEGMNKRKHFEAHNYHFHHSLITQFRTKLVIVYDYRMLSHHDKDNPNALERPERLIAIDDTITKYGIRDRVEMIKGTFLTEDDILLLHSKYYVNEIKRLCEEPFPHDYLSVYVNDCTYECARLAAGSSIAALKKVAENMAQMAFAIVRPPGHHAEIDAACGFCIFNNIALVTKYALDTYNYEKILIVDFDIHHCNGTTNIFEDDNRVLVISLHRYDEGKFFPSSGDPHNIGFCKGKHYNVHVAWNHKGVTDAEYFAAFERVVMPVAHQFNPQLIMVSAGYDAAIYDPIGQCCLSPEMFGHLCHMIKGVCSKMVLLLEGGYCITSLSHSVVMSIKALLGDPPLYVADSKTISEAALASINQTIEIHKNFWSFLPTSPKISQDPIHKAIQTIQKLNKNELEHVSNFMSKKFVDTSTASSISSICSESKKNCSENRKSIFTFGDDPSKVCKDEKLPKDVSLWLQSFGETNHFSTESSGQASRSEADTASLTDKFRTSDDEDYPFNEKTKRNSEKYFSKSTSGLTYKSSKSGESPTAKSFSTNQYSNVDLQDYFKAVSNDSIVFNQVEQREVDLTADEFLSGNSPFDTLDTTFNSSSCSSLHEKDDVLTIIDPEEEDMCMLDEEEDPNIEETESKETFDKFKHLRRDKTTGFKAVTRLSDIAEQSEFSSDNLSNGSKPKIFDDGQRDENNALDEEQTELKMMEKPIEQRVTMMEPSESDIYVRQCGRFYIF